jgi:acyl-homoserine lactone acylase PvdQ
MFKQVFLYNGTPYLAYKGEDGEYDYPKDEWTETPPPEGIYSPFYFDGNEWVGSTREEWETTLPEKEIYMPSQSEMMLAQAQMQVTKTASRLIKSQEEQAKVNLELTKKEKRIQELEKQQAQTMLEISKLKGE